MFILGTKNQDISASAAPLPFKICVPPQVPQLNGSAVLNSLMNLVQLLAVGDLTYSPGPFCSSVELFPTQLKTSAVKVSGLGVSPRSRQKNQFLHCQLQLTRMHCTELHSHKKCSAFHKGLDLHLTFPYQKLSPLHITSADAIVIHLSMELVKCKKAGGCKVGR